VVQREKEEAKVWKEGEPEAVFEIECRHVEGRASRSIMERENRGRDENKRGGRIGAEADVEGTRSGLERTCTGRGRGRPTIGVDTQRVVAQLRANHLLSATQCGPVMTLIISPLIFS